MAQDGLYSKDKTMAYLEKVNAVNERGAIVNPATDEQIVLLRRIAKVLETTGSADIAQRQKITIDAITANLTLATVAAVTAITNSLPAGANTIGNVTVGGMDHKQFIDIARTAYANGIRNKLIFS
jgi:hypothetical protein